MLASLSTLLCVAAWVGGSDQNTLRRGQYRGPFEELVAIVGPSPTPTGAPAVPPTANPNAPVLNQLALLEGYERWEFWFELNKDLLLRSRDFRRREVLTLRPPSADSGDDGRVRAEDARASIAQALRAALKSNDPRVQQYAALGLGRIGARESMPLIEEMLASGDQDAKRMATLALGLLEERGVLSRLLNLLHDTANVPVEIRSAAALAIGLQGRREGARALTQFLERTFKPDSVLGDERDLYVCAVTALGMCRDRDSAPFLLSAYKTLREAQSSRSRGVETNILTALGRIGDPSALLVLLEALDDKSIDLRRAAAQALGDLGDRASVKALVKSFFEDGDEQTRGFTAISLGRIGGEAARDALREGFQTKGSRTVKAFSAIGLGLLGDRGSSTELLKGLAMHSEDSLRGSIAIALGLLEEPKAAEPLLKLVETRGTLPQLRGYAALALGMIKPEGSLDRLVKVLEEDADKVDVWRRSLCLAIGLYHSPKAAPALAKVMFTDARDLVREHSALALGLARSRAQIEPLVKQLEKDQYRGDLALFCVVALSSMGDRHEYPLISESFFNANYRVRNPMLEELQQIL